MTRLQMAAIIAAATFCACHQSKDESRKQISAQPLVAAVQQQAPIHSSLRPPIPGCDIGYEEHTVNAESGGTVHTSDGTELVFPSNAFIDAEGKIVSGKVDIKYRDFSEPLSFFLSGIPMSYEAKGKSHVFSSAGMCELLAFKEGKALFVNPGAKPQIKLPTNNSASNYKLYAFDSTNGQWQMQSNNKDVPVQKAVAQTVTVSIPATPTSSLVIDYAGAPVKLDRSKPFVKAEIDKKSFPELVNYENVYFQVDVNKNGYDQTSGTEVMQQLNISKGGRPGLYALTFGNAYEENTFYSSPVFDGPDYARLIKEYTTRKKIEEEKRAQTEKEQEKKRREDWTVSDKMYRVFTIEKFGIWNCDRLLTPEVINVSPQYVDKRGNKIEPYTVAVLMRSLNSAITYSANSPLRLLKEGENMLVCVYNGELMYATNKDIRSMRLQNNTKATFVLSRVSGRDYKALRAAIN